MEKCKCNTPGELGVKSAPSPHQYKDFSGNWCNNLAFNEGPGMKIWKVERWNVYSDGQANPDPANY